MALTINELFDEQFYLENNPEVAEAVANRLFYNSFSHFIQFGQFESRDPNPIFNTEFYLATNGGVASAVEQNILTPTEHFINYGQFEQRDSSALFNTSFYLDRYPEIATAVATTPLTSTEHFLNFGQFEGRLPRLLFSNIYVFGDSYSDTGNAFTATGGALPGGPPYFEGRFSNGLLWVETLVPHLGLDVNPNLNFAVAGATTGVDNVLKSSLPEGVSLIDLQTEIDGFIAETPATDSDALYVVWAGINDYATPTADVQSTIDNLSVAVNKLASIGAKNFVLPNIPNSRLVPFVQDFSVEDQQTLALLTESHNSNLAAVSQTLEKNLNVNIIDVDVGTLVDNIAANPSSFGLTNITDSFLTSGLDNIDDFLFIDNIHVTTIGHNLIADEAIKSITEINELLSIVETSPGF